MAEKGMEEEFLTCSICYDVFKEPKTLSCLHRFCGKCLHSFILSQKKSVLQKLNGFPCPVCREVIKVQKPFKDPAEWASQFKTDFHLTNLIRFVARTPTQGAQSKNMCKVHKDIPQDLYCVDCQDIICHMCSGINHRRCNNVVTLEEIASQKKSEIIKSVKRIEEQIKVISTSRERALDNFEKLKSNAETEIKSCANEWRSAIDTEEQRLLQILENKCRKVYEKITPLLIEFDRKISDFDEKTRNIQAGSDTVPDFDVMSMFPKGIDLNAIGLDSYQKVVTFVTQLNVRFEQIPEHRVTMGDVVFNSHNQTRGAPSHPKQIEITSESGSCVAYTLDNHETVLYSSECSQKDNPFRGLEPSTTSNNSMRRSLREKLSKFMPSSFSQSAGTGSMATNQAPPTSQKPSNANNKGVHFCVPEGTTNPPRQSCDSTSSASNEGRSAVQKLRVISTRFRDDSTEPKLRDVVVLSQGGSNVIVTDWANQCVKAFYVRRDKDCRLQVGGRPWSITQLSDSSAAVSIPLSRQICIIKTTSPLTMQNSFVAAKSYSGLATLNSQLLVASGGMEPPCVDIINLYGEIVQSFSTFPDGSPLFLYPSYVCVTPSLSIMVSDKKLGAVICMSHKGDIKFKFCPSPPKNLQEPCGLCATPSGHVMVLETRGLLQLTPDGQMDRPLVRKIDGYVNDPKGVAMDKDGLIYVTTDEQEVAVFQISG